MNSFKPEVQVVNDPAWYSNALRFASEAEATFYVVDWSMRWTQVRNLRVIPSDDVPTHVWAAGRAMALPEKVPVPEDVVPLLDRGLP
jgi:hypothetical protein